MQNNGIQASNLRKIEALIKALRERIQAIPYQHSPQAIRRFLQAYQRYDIRGQQITEIIGLLQDNPSLIIALDDAVALIQALSREYGNFLKNQALRAIQGKR